MPITQQEAIAWMGSATADQLAPIPTVRLTWGVMRSIVDFSTQVIHCFVPGGATPPILPNTVASDHLLQGCCCKVLERDSTKRRGSQEAFSLAYTPLPPRDEVKFLATFTRRDEVNFHPHNYPFLKVGMRVSPALTQNYANETSCAAHVRRTARHVV